MNITIMHMIDLRWAGVVAIFVTGLWLGWCGGWFARVIVDELRQNHE